MLILLRFTQNVTIGQKQIIRINGLASEVHLQERDSCNILIHSCLIYKQQFYLYRVHFKSQLLNGKLCKAIAIDLSREDIQIRYSRITQIINIDSINFKLFCKPFRNSLFIIKLIQSHHIRGLVYLCCKASGDVIFNLGWLSHNVNISWIKRSKLYLLIQNSDLSTLEEESSMGAQDNLLVFFSSGREPVCEVQEFLWANP